MEPVADRYSYLPSVGIALLAGGGLAAAWRRGGAWRALAGALGIALLLAFSRLTLAQTARWKSSIGLWESVVAGAPPRPDYEDAYVNLGAAYAEAGRLGEAREALERAVTIDPDNAGALYNLGVMRYAAGEKESAAESFRRATRADPADARAFYNLAIVLDELGHTEEAMTAMKEAARLGNPEAREALSAPSSRP
jgi:tetratricopeptide (TPR) repeat protein